MVVDLPKYNKSLKDYLDIMHTAVTGIKLSWKAHPLLTGIFLLGQFLEGLLPVTTIWLSKEIINSIVHQSTAPAFAGSALNYVFLLIGFSFVLAVFQNFLVTVRFFVTSRLYDELARYAHRIIIEQSLALDMEYFESPEFFDRYEKARTTIDHVLPNVLKASAYLFGVLISLISVSFLLIQIHWLLLPLIVIINLPILLWGMGFSFTTHSLSSSRTPAARKAAYVGNLATSKESIKEVKLFGLSGYLKKQYEGFFDKLVTENWENSKKQFSGAFLTSIISDVTYYGFFVWSAYRAFMGIITIGDLTLFIQSFHQADGSIRNMLSHINHLYENGLYIRDFNAFIQLKPKVVDKPDALTLGKITHIKFENVSFKYKPHLPKVLDSLSFEINENENVALVGINGVGKTTLIKLLLRFYDVAEGAIYINGKNVKDYKIVDLWAQFGTLFQDFEHYQLTVKENIAFGQLNKIEDFDALQRAAARSGAADFIEGFPAQYDTVLGTRFEGGTDLSLGQWQKVALARAFIRDCSVLILDEPTASLDAKAEYEIFKKFIELVEGKITILISHRFSTVRIADKILVLSDGKIIEHGTHSELMNTKGMYSEMFTLQAEGYK